MNIPRFTSPAGALFGKIPMLEQLFGSNTRARLLNLFLRNSDRPFFVRELTRKIHAHINSVRRELRNLEEIGLLRSEGETTAGGEANRKIFAAKKYYKISKDFVLFQELQALILKSQLLLQKDLKHKIAELGKIHYLALTGSFLGREDLPVDLFMVGRVNPVKLKRLIGRFEKSLGDEINYTAMPIQEFNYRRQITDRFLFSIVESPKIVLIDNIELS
jgi:hypothetical protein